MRIYIQLRQRQIDNHHEKKNQFFYFWSNSIVDPLPRRTKKTISIRIIQKKPPIAFHLSKSTSCSFHFLFGFFYFWVCLFFDLNC